MNSVKSIVSFFDTLFGHMEFVKDSFKHSEKETHSNGTVYYVWDRKGLYFR